VLYTNAGNVPIWSTQQLKPGTFVMEDNGNLVQYGTTKAEVLWTSNTAVAAPAPPVPNVPAPAPVPAAALPVVFPALDAGKLAPTIVKCTRPGLIALTFDDGPSKNAPSLLAKLNELQIKSTFFVNAKNFAQFEDPNSPDALVLKRIFDAGHQIASHTLSHADLVTLSNQGRWDEMRLNDEAIRRIIGVRPTHMRAPYLSTNAQVEIALGTWGYRIISINLDTKDYEHSGLTNEVQLSEAAVFPSLENSNPGQDSFIILNHDYTANIVAWVESLYKKSTELGYRFVTTAECIGDGNPYRP
jgi:peptidoglycan/xylan/chitin deacetylase (PgdA/CDA1 family)